MKRILILILVTLVAYGAYRYVQNRMKTDLALNSKIAGLVDKGDELAKSVAGVFNALKDGASKAVKTVSAQDDAGGTPVGGITIHLKHGGVISGRLIEKRQDAYVVDWKGERFEVAGRQIARVEQKSARDAEWPYSSGMAIVRTNGVVVDGQITAVGPEDVTVSFSQGGGGMEMGIRRKDIDHVLFAPVLNRESVDIEARLRKLFPKMKVYKDGNVTILTDSYPKTAASYRKSLGDFYTEIYLRFFKLFRLRAPQRQCFVVIFDDFSDYVEYAVTDGVPGWVAVGYFSPVDKTLYTFNAFGERMEKMVFDVMVGKSGKALDAIVGAIKSRVDSRYHIFIDGQVKELSDKYWEMYNIYKTELVDMTASTIRHEFAHEVFNNWALQSIVLSMPKIDKDKMAAKKKEFLDAKDYRKKEELLMGLMKMKKEEYRDTEIASAQSWLSEGIATYCATEPIGAVDENWLFIYQDASRKGEVNPIEFLTNFRVGSFPGLVHKAVLGSYAQSWALASFLMEKYPDQFMAYQARFASDRPKDGEEELQWLLSSIGKDLPALEKEFALYMKAYPAVEDPDVKRYMRYYKVWDDLMASG
jgi:hypothetical protein